MIGAEVIMRSDVRIRPASGADQAFVQATTGRLAAFGPPPWRTAREIVEGERRTLQSFFIAAPPGTALLIAERDAPLGYVYLETLVDYFTGQRHGHVGIIAVTGVAEGTGAGRALLEAAAAWAHASGFQRLTLNVFAGNERARRIYERAGFRVETLRYVRDV
jgi:ribosomal protein S18 acetylase RimI-like enzyme